jgi:hypothetical protein
MKLRKQIINEERKEIPLKKIIRAMPPIPRPTQRPVQFNPQFTPQPNQIRPVQRTTQMNPRAQQRPQTIEIGSNTNFNNSDLGKIQPILMDPSVQSLECPGPDRPITVNKGGRIQVTNIILKSEDIESMIETISRKTRIPKDFGVFKAAFDNYVMTAVLSEFVGSRFIISKKNPFIR